MEREHFSGQMDRFTKGNGSKVKRMVVEFGKVKTGRVI